MKNDLSAVEKLRRNVGPYISSPGDRFGIFLVTKFRTTLHIMVCEACDEMPWDHVSVSGVKSGRGHTPTWDEMCYVKDLFFDEAETVMQLHPPKSEYVNYHNHCLHLWRPLDGNIPHPPSIAVGPKGGM